MHSYVNYKCCVIFRAKNVTVVHTRAATQEKWPENVRREQKSITVNCFRTATQGFRAKSLFREHI